MRLWTARGIPTVMAGTPGIELAHAVDERVRVDDLVTLARRSCASRWSSGRDQGRARAARRSRPPTRAGQRGAGAVIAARGQRTALAVAGRQRRGGRPVAMKSVPIASAASASGPTWRTRAPRRRRTCSSTEMATRKAWRSGERSDAVGSRHRTSVAAGGGGVEVVTLHTPPST